MRPVRMVTERGEPVRRGNRCPPMTVTTCWHTGCSHYVVMSVRKWHGPLSGKGRRRTVSGTSCWSCIRSLLEETLRERRDQRATMSDLRRELAPLITAEQSDVASITKQVGAMAEMVARELDVLGDGLVDLDQQLAQLTDRMNSWPPCATTTSMPHRSIAPGPFQKTNAD